MGSTEELVLHVNGWILLGLSVGSLGTAVFIIYRLLAKLADMVIVGIHDKIHECQEELSTEIADAKRKAALAHDHAEGAHIRVGRIESVLMQKGASSMEKVK